MRQNKRLLVSDIHPANLLLFWILSFFIAVEAYRINRVCPRVLSKRIEAVDLGKYLPSNESRHFRSHVVQLWERTLENVPRKDWIFQYRGLPLDFTTKAKQELGFQFERLLFLQEIMRRGGPDSRIFLIDSPHFRYLRRLDPAADFSKVPVFPIISQMNVSLDLLFAYFHNLVRSLSLLQTMLHGCFHRDRRRLQLRESIPFIWDAVSSNELTLDTDRLFFPWVVDGKRIKSEDVLFILPPEANKNSRPDLHSSGYSAFTIPELYGLVKFIPLLGRLLNLLVWLSRYLFPIPRGLASIQKAGYIVAVMRLEPIVQHLRPTCYITNLSRVGNEDPAVVYLDSIDVKTVMYCFSASHSTFVDGDRECDFRTVMFANILASVLIVWHRDYQKFIQQHPQEKTKVEVIGPLMAGNESIFESTPDVLRNVLGFRPTAKGKDMRYISIFDVPATSQDISLTYNRFADHYTEEYNLAFLRDMMKLLEDFDDIAIVFKPKKSLVATKYTYANEFQDLVVGLNNNERGLTVADDINPWLPIAIADLCIGMPFTSPPLAAMHYGIPGMYHDATGVVLHHRYQCLDHCITHDYTELRSKVRSLLFDTPPCDEDKEVVWSEGRGFIGDYPGTDSSDRFRDLLQNIVSQKG